MRSLLFRWEGAASLAWIALAFLLVSCIADSDILFHQTWLYCLIVFVGWWGIGLVLAISGLKHGHWASRACAMMSIGAFVLFACTMLAAVFKARF